MSDQRFESFRIKDLKSEEGAEELASSPDMKPYLQFIMAEMQGQNTDSLRRAIAELPLEKRYVWRVASALKWAFADFDQSAVNLDRETLSPEDVRKIIELLRLRPIQMCIFVKTLIGVENMERFMTEGIAVAKQVS